MLRFSFFSINHPSAFLLLLFRKKSHSHRLTACKRAAFTQIGSPPTFCGCACRRRSFLQHLSSLGVVGNTRIFSLSKCRYEHPYHRRRGLCIVRNNFFIKVVDLRTPSRCLSAPNYAAPSPLACKRAHNAHALYQLFAGAPAVQGRFLESLHSTPVTSEWIARHEKSPAKWQRNSLAALPFILFSQGGTLAAAMPWGMQA